MVLGWGFFTSFLWLSSLTLNRVSAFHMYCCLHILHSIKYMTYALKQLPSEKILYIFWACWILKVNVAMTWLQDRVLLFPRNRKHFPGFKVLLFILFTLLFSILLNANEFFEIFVAFKYCNCFVLKKFVQRFLNR